MKRIACLIASLILCSTALAAPTRITLAIVADSSVNAWFGGDDATLNELIEQGRIAAELIRPTGVVLDHVMTELHNAPPSTRHPIGVLSEIELRRADITVLVTGGPLFIGTQAYRGYALPYSVCESKGRAIVSIQGDGYDAETLAHEIGHVLGMPHDGTSPCAGESPEAYIMSSRVVGNTAFSQCSIDQMKMLLSLPGCLVSSAPVTTPPTRGSGAFEWLILGWLLALVCLVLIARWGR